MRISGILFLLISLISCSKSQLEDAGGVTTTPKPVFVIAGESNAGGGASNTYLTPFELSERSSLKIFNNYNKLFENLDIQTNNLLGHAGIADNASHGLENGLAYCADSGRLGHLPTYLIKCGQGGAKISDWLEHTQYAGSVNPWDSLVTRTDSALKIITAQNDGADPQLILIWTLGINDTKIPIDSYQWKDSTKAFFTKYRLRYGVNAPVIMLYLPATTEFSEYNLRIAELETEVSNFYTVRTDNAPLQNAHHWNATGLRILATRIVDVLLMHYPNYFL